MRALLLTAAIIYGLAMPNLYGISRTIPSEELEFRLTLAETPEDQLLILNQLANRYASHSIAKAYQYNKQALSLHTPSIDQDLRADTYMALGYIQENEFINIDEILKNYYQALQLFSKDNIRAQIEVHNHIGLIYQKHAQYKNSLNHFQMAFGLIDSDPEMYLFLEREILISTSISHFLNGDSKNSLSALSEVKSIHAQNPHLKSDLALFKVMGVQGLNDMAMGKIDEAEKVFDYLNNQPLENIPPEFVSKLYIISGQLYRKKKQYTVAEEYYAKSLALGKEYGNSHIQLRSLKYLARNAFENDQIQESQVYCQRAIDLTNAANVKIELMDLYSLMYDLHKYQKDYPKALSYHEKFKTLSDSLQLEKLTAGTGIKDYINHINNQNTKLALLQRDHEVSQWQLYFLLGISFLGIAFTSVVVYALWRKMKLNKLLRDKYKELKIAKNEAVAASIAKQNFLSVMSHEMRTPLNAILGLTNIIIDESPRDDQVNHMNNLKFSAKNLLFIINNILDFNKIDAGKVTLVNEEFNLNALLDNIINSLRYSRQKGKLLIKHDSGLSDIQNLILGDSIRLNQILVNLLGNAIKFTEEGHVILRSRILEKSGTTVRVRFDIEDTGIGIAQDEIDQIFESFTQVKQSHTRKHEGTGLGLAITKRLVHLQNGELFANSKEGQGSTFSFILEFQKGKLLTSAPPVKEVQSIYQQGIEGLRVLAVEDNKINQVVVMNTLKKFKTHATLAKNGQEAVDAVKMGNFDVILMDIHMPIMDGISATKAIRAMESEARNTPIIGLSADAYSDAIKKGMDAGMNAYMTKPFKPGDLFASINKACEENTVRIES